VELGWCCVVGMVGRGLPAESKQGIQRAALELHEQQPVSVAQAYVLRAGKGGNHHWTEVFGQTETSHGGDGRNESARPGTEQGRHRRKLLPLPQLWPSRARPRARTQNRQGRVRVVVSQRATGANGDTSESF
jgi:hypothetical protein